MQKSSTARFGPELLAYRPKRDHLKKLFRPQDVEILLDQAADLLDRVQRDNTEYHVLGEKLAAAEDLVREHQTLTTHDSLAGQLLMTEFHPQGGAQVSDLEQRALLAERYSHYKQIDPIVRSMHAYNNGGRPAEGESASAASFSAHFMSDALQLRRLQEQYLAQLRLAVRESRIKRAKAENDALNFSERRANLYQKILADSKDAIDRLIQAQIGLREFYGIEVSSESDGLFDVSIPGERPELEVVHFPDPNPISPKPLMNEYDALHLWTRRAISQLVRITRRDQPFSILVSVKTLLANLGTPWNAGATEWVLKKIPGLSRQEHELIRLRGVSVSLVTVGESLLGFDSFQGELSCQLPTSDATPSSMSCFLGRVRPANALRDGDVFGEVLLHNIDPFLKEKGGSAEWTLSLGSKSVLGIDRSDATIQDVIVEFHVVAQAV